MIDFFAQANQKMADRIRKDLKVKCVADTHSPWLRELFQCAAGAMGEASMKNGMATVWKEYEPKLKQHFAAWKQCNNHGDEMKKLL